MVSQPVKPASFTASQGQRVGVPVRPANWRVENASERKRLWYHLSYSADRLEAPAGSRADFTAELEQH